MAKEENYDYKASMAVEKWLKLKNETQSLKQQIAKNEAEMKLLLSEFPIIGNFHGMLRKEKPKPAVLEKKSEKEPETESSKPKSPPRNTTSSPKRKKTAREDLEAKLSELKSPKRKRTAPVETGSGTFHSTSHTAPSHQSTSAMIIDNKGTSQ